MLVQRNILEAIDILFDFDKLQYDQKVNEKKVIPHFCYVFYRHSSNFMRKSILTRDFVYMRSRAISADSNLARRQATVNL